MQCEYIISAIQKAKREAIEDKRHEQALWLMTVQQAFMDAASNISHKRAKEWKASARDWLSSGGKDMAMVCDYAGLHWPSLRDYARQLFYASSRSPRLPVLDIQINQHGQLYIAEWLTQPRAINKVR